MIYLYIKTHNITGLKYFGKTTKKDPYRYKGSGIYWLKHLKKYGVDVSTEIIGCFEDEEECSKIALQFSKISNIVESEEWANLKEENGLDGSPKGVKFSDEHREKMSLAHRGKSKNAGIPKTIEHKNKIRNSVIQALKCDEIKNKMKKPKTNTQNMKKPKKEMVCPVCGKVGRGGVMKRYHFTNCKRISESTE